MINGSIVFKFARSNLIKWLRRFIWGLWLLIIVLFRFGLQNLQRTGSRFLNWYFLHCRMHLVAAVCTALDNFKNSISSLSSLIFLSYFLCYISFVCDRFRDGEISCLRKGLNGLDDCSLSCMFLLLNLLFLVKHK